MSFARPTLSELVDRIQADLVSRLSLATPLLRRSMVYVLARVLAGAAHLLYGFISFLARQVFPDLSDEEYLVRQAGLFGIVRTAATYQVGNLDLTGTNGTVVPEGTLFVHANGYEYITTAEVTIAAGVATAPYAAETAGADPNLESGDEVTVESPISGLDSVAIVSASGLVDGSDQESIEDLRVRFLARLQAPPHGGNADDYVAWAKEVAGVTRAWCFPLEDGPGTVTVRFMRDGDVDPFPDAGEVTEVQDHIDEVRPVTADVTVEAPVDDPVDMTIHVEPDTADTRAAATSGLEDYYFRFSAPGETTLLSQLEVAVGTAEGVVDFTISIPVGNVAHSAGELGTLGVITWV